MYFRFIPAGAGNSLIITSSLVVTAVYPRWRGELQVTIYRMTHNRGLSPLARGTLRAQMTGDMRERFIPAGAGNSQRRIIKTTSPAVYPRWRGELQHLARGMQNVNGLSPLARGTRMIYVPLL